MWNPTLPSIYQIEVASRCNLRCPFCPTGVANGVADDAHNGLIDPDLFYTIVERDTASSHFIELQFRGEPTLNKHLGDYIDALHNTGIKAGLSTHGGLLHRPGVMDAMLKLDYLTVSIDSVDPNRYETLRVGGDFNQLMQNLNDLFNHLEFNKSPQVDLQIIKSNPNWEEDVERLRLIAIQNSWFCTVRVINDTLHEFQYGNLKRYDSDPNNLCLNPWLSVSIHADGDVVPCCMSWGKEIVYGNLKQASLEEIWNGNPVLDQFRRQHRAGTPPAPCDRCFARSPCLIHDRIERQQW